MSIKYLLFLTEKMVMKMVMVNVSGENKTNLILSPTGPSFRLSWKIKLRICHQ